MLRVSFNRTFWTTKSENAILRQWIRGSSREPGRTFTPEEAVFPADGHVVDTDTGNKPEASELEEEEEKVGGASTSQGCSASTSGSFMKK